MGELILCTAKGSVALAIVDVDAGTAVDRIVVGEPEVAKPHEIAIARDGRRAFVTIYGDADYGRNTPDNRIAVVDLEARRLERHIDLDLYRGPHALAMDHAGKLWVTVEESHSVLVIDTEQLAIEKTVWMQAPVHFAAADSSGRTLYFTHKQYPFVTEVDAAERTVTARIDLAVGAQALCVSRDDALLYVGDFNRPLLHVVDRSAHRVVRSVPLSGVPGWPYQTPDGRTLVMTTWIEAEGRGFIELLDPQTFKPRHVLEIAAEPFHALASADGKRLFAALGTGKIAVVDLESGALSTTIDVDGGMLEALAAMPRPA